MKYYINYSDEIGGGGSSYILLNVFHACFKIQLLYVVKTTTVQQKQAYLHG